MGRDVSLLDFSGIGVTALIEAFKFRNCCFSVCVLSDSSIFAATFSGSAPLSVKA